MEKLILKRPIKTDGYKPFLMDTATHEKLAQIKEDTGISMTQIVAQMVEFCIPKIKIEG